MFKNTKINTKIFVSIYAMLMLMLVLFYFGNMFFSNISENKSIVDHTRSINERFINLIQQDVDSISTSMDIFIRNNEIQNIYLENDRQELYNYVLPIFEKIKQGSQVSHLYFHSLDGVVFLRMHEFKNYGDNVTRNSFLKARNNQNIGFGLELGKNVFALRVVKPYYKNNTLIGYVEFAEQIDHILESLKKETLDDFFLIVQKDKMSRADWKFIREKNGLTDNWDENEKYVAVSQTQYDIKNNRCFQSDFLSILENDITSIKHFKEGKKSFTCSGIKVIGSDGSDIGIISIVHDISSEKRQNLISNVLIITIAFVLLSVFLTILYLIFIKTIIRPINHIVGVARNIVAGNLETRIKINSNDEIGEMSKLLNSVADSFVAINTNLEKKISERTEELTVRNQESEQIKMAVLNILEDVEETKNNLELEKDKIEAILYGMGDGVFVIDKDLRIIIFNNAAESISGFSAKDVIGRKYNSIIKFVLEKDGKQIQDLFIENIIQGKNIGISNKSILIKKNNEQVNTSNSASALKDKDDKLIGCIVVFRDVTIEQRVNQAKTEFVSLASHQLRTPLSSINWYAEMLLAGDAGKLNKNQKKFVDEIYAGNQRMVELVNDLLNVSRLELGTFMINPDLTDLLELSDSVIKELQSSIITKKLKINTDYDKSIGKISIDPVLTRIIFQNLLSNAVKYTPNNGDIYVSIKKKLKSVLIDVVDTGYGIPKAQQDKMFTKLFRGDNVKAKDIEGTGLGSYIVKSILDSAGGRISFESEENKGTAFHVELPLSGMKKRSGEKKLS